MFYSHDILTSREGGIATVWLVATLGSKTNNKKVNRKSILEVDVKKACDIIIQPEAPMALRLQGNLLYGVVRVYSRQFDYVLSDAETIQANIRALLKAVKTSELDPAAGKARPDQLMILDDPSFLPDLAFPGLDIGLSALDITTDESSRLPSILDSHSQRSTSLSSGHEAADTSVIPLIIPSSDHGGSGGLGGFELPSGPPTGSARGSAGFGRMVNDDEDFNIDLGFGFDEDGNMFEEEPTRNEGATNQLRMLRLATDSRLTPTGNMQGPSIERKPGFFDVANFNNEDQLLPDAEPFPAMAGGTAARDAGSNGSAIRVSKERGTESSFGAPLQRRKKRAPRQLPVDDEQTTLRSAQLQEMKANYLANMAEAISAQVHRKAAATAKKNAEYFIMDLGIGGIGARIGTQNVKSPLDVFSGPAFLDSLRGIHSTVPHKRTREDDEDDDAYDADNEGRNVRSGLPEDNILQDDDAGLGLADEGIEVGRHAQPPLEDPSMPWNVSASSRQGSIVRGRGALSSIGGFPSSAGGQSGSFGGGGLGLSSVDRRASRITSASPLGHRGQQQRHSSLGQQAPEESNVLHSDDRNITDPQALEDFEFYGPGAGVATQTAADSQWVRDALTQEAGNFLEFVKTEIDARQSLPLQSEQGIRDDNRPSILFEELLPPAQHSKTVGAQGFYHLLALATGGRLNVTQLNEDEFEGFGPILVELPVAM